VNDKIPDEIIVEEVREIDDDSCQAVGGTSHDPKSKPKTADPDRWRKIKKEFITNNSKFVDEDWDVYSCLERDLSRC